MVVTRTASKPVLPSTLVSLSMGVLQEQMVGGVFVGWVEEVDQRADSDATRTTFLTECFHSSTPLQAQPGDPATLMLRAALAALDPGFRWDAKSRWRVSAMLHCATTWDDVGLMSASLEPQPP